MIFFDTTNKWTLFVASAKQADIIEVMALASLRSNLESTKLFPMFLQHSPHKVYGKTNTPFRFTKAMI